MNTADLTPWFASVLPAALAGFIVWSLKRYTNDLELRDQRLEKAIKELAEKIERIHELDLLGQRLNTVEGEIANIRPTVHRHEGDIRTLIAQFKERRASGSWPRVPDPEEG